MAKNLTFILLAVLIFNLLAAMVSAASPPASPPPRYSLLISADPETARVPPAVQLPATGVAAVPGLASPQPHSRAATTPEAAKAAAQLFSLNRELTAGAVAEGERREEAAEQDWRWRRVGGMEYAVVSVAALATAYFEHENGRPTEADWTSRNEFDEEIRSALRLHSRAARDATGIAGDAIMGLMIGAPVLDAFATLGIRDRNWDALWQTEMVNLEAFTFTSLVSSLTQNLLARERPFVRDCRDGACEDRLENRGFPSGHVAFAFTGAGLLCNHHRYQGLYRDPATSRAVCGTGIGLAIADGVLRIVSDDHYATDVVAGTVLGLFSGFMLPRLLHYDHPLKPAATKGHSGSPLIRQVRFMPLLTSNSTGLICEFRF